MHHRRTLIFQQSRCWFQIAATYVLFSIKFGEVRAQDCGQSDLIVWVDNTCLLLKSIPPYETVPGSNITYRCANRLLQLPTTTYNYCPVELCLATGWNNATLSCAANECYEPGLSRDYIGRRQCGLSGTKCQQWNSQTPHPHPYVSADFPDTSIDAAGFYCRDPAGSKGQPWCYVNDPNVEWEYCEIPICADLPVNEGDCADCGQPDLTVTTDLVCPDYYVPPPPPTSTMYGTLLKYTCPSLISKHTSTEAFCPVKKCTADGVWTNASISCGDNECYEGGFAQWYQGSRACTRLGAPCIRWDEATILYDDSLFPEGSRALAGSFCRDPALLGQPWCFTSTQNSYYYYCDVPLCADMNITTCGAAPTTPTIPSLPSVPVLPNVGGLNANTTYTKMAQDQTSFGLLEILQSRSNLNCATKCNKGHNCQLYTFNKQLQQCTLYQPDLAGADVVCSGPDICYRRNF